MCFAPHFLSLKLPNVLRTWCVLRILTSQCVRATAACSFSSLISLDGSAPAAVASLFFSGATKHSENAVFRDYSTRLPGSSFFCLFFSDLLPSAFSFSDPSHLCFSICPYCWKFDLQTSFNEFKFKLGEII